MPAGPHVPFAANSPSGLKSITLYLMIQFSLVA